jgi:hypothetical protein
MRLNYAHPPSTASLNMPIEITQSAESEAVADDELKAAPDAESQAVEGDAAQGAEGEAGSEGGSAEGGEGELLVTIGDESPPAEEAEHSAPQWVKDLRKQNRELVRKTRDLEQRLQVAQPVQQAVAPGLKPTLAGCEYDEEKFAADLEAWHERKLRADEQQREAERKQQAQAAEWNKRLDGYKKQALQLRIPNFEAAEEVVRDTLNVTQQSLIIKACKQPALMVAALGNNERKARELAAITDPVEFVAEVVRTEAQLRTQARKPSTAPEKAAPRSSMSGASAVDSELARLQAQAAKTGDRTPVVRYLQGKARQTA